jgi:hypothetical protein
MGYRQSRRPCVKKFTMPVSNPIWKKALALCWAMLICWLVGMGAPAGILIRSWAAGVETPASATRALRDWKKHPAIVEIDMVKDAFTVGDVHGGYERLVKLLAAGKIIDPDPARPDRVSWRANRI